MIECSYKHAQTVLAASMARYCDPAEIIAERSALRHGWLGPTLDLTRDLPMSSTRKPRQFPPAPGTRPGSATLDGGKSEDVLPVERQLVIGSSLEDVERALLPNAAPMPLDLSREPGFRPQRVIARRYFLAAQEGEGYWDMFRFHDFLVTVTDALYNKDLWIRVDGDRYFKVRVLLEGELVTERGETLAKGPNAHLYVSPAVSRGGYFIRGGNRTRLVILHARPDLLLTRLGLGAEAMPPPFDAFSRPDGPPVAARMGLQGPLISLAEQLVKSRHELAGALRTAFVESAAVSLLCRALAGLSDRDALRAQSHPMSRRDLNRILEARDYLAQNFARPPTIPELARLVGLSQTKLKVRFRAAVGKPIYGYVLERRMEHAAHLLATGEHSVAEVAYLVGYDYPANFSIAFRRFHGRAPRAFRRT
jgi:AraC-like DNA-binding protein